MSSDMIFADESGTDGKSPCYAIGAIKIEPTKFDDFNHYFLAQKSRRKVVGELKWTRIGSSTGAINFCLDMVGYLIEKDIPFGCIVVNKKEFRKWTESEEKAFYMTYNYLLKDIIQVTKNRFEVYIDGRDDSYDKNDEVMELITNRMLRKQGASSSITQVTKSNSKLFYPIQIADMLTGAITSSTNLFLNKAFPVNDGKTKAIEAIANSIGWDALHYDTYPNKKFNIWHFPIEFRNRPKTKRLRVKGKLI